MSRGMLLLVGAFVSSPLIAQPPEPAPLPRTKGVAVELRIQMPPLSTQSAPPPEVHRMMLQTLEQMSGPITVPVQPLPCPQVFPPTQTFVRSTQVVPAQPVSPLPVGTWTREIGPLHYKLEIKDGHLIATVTITEEENGKTVRFEHVLMADCYATRNPGEVVGLVTAFDIATTGTTVSREDVLDILKSLPEFQKTLIGKPMALKFRVYDETIVIGDMRLPFNKNEGEDVAVAFNAMAGKYKSTTPPAPAPVTAASYQTLPLISPYYNGTYGSGVPPVGPDGRRPYPFRNGGN